MLPKNSKRRSRTESRPITTTARPLTRKSSKKKKRTVPPLAADNEALEAMASENSNSGINDGSELTVPLTRSDIPSIVREITRQLRPAGAVEPEIQMPLTPSTMFLFSCS